MKHLKIEQVIGREIIDSRGNPTVEAEVILEGGVSARAGRSQRSFYRRI